MLIKNKKNSYFYTLNQLTLKHMKKIIPLLLSFFILAGIARAQVPNAGMESWINNFGYEDPEDWTTFNLFSFLTGAPFTVNKTTDAHSGSFAATVESILYTDTSGTPQQMPGIAYTVFPNTTRFANFSFWHKFNNVGGDTAIVGVYLSKWNAGTQMSDSVGIAFAIITSTVNSYTLVNVPFQYFTSATPDTAYVLVLSNATENFIAGSKLWVDDFILSGIASISELSSANVSLYPNPAPTELMLEMAIPIKGLIEIYDVNGKIVSICAINGTHTTVSVADLPSNTYLYIIKDNSGKAMSAGKALLGQ